MCCFACSEQAPPPRSSLFLRGVVLSPGAAHDLADNFIELPITALTSSSPLLVNAVVSVPVIANNSRSLRPIVSSASADVSTSPSTPSLSMVSSEASALFASLETVHPFFLRMRMFHL